eukprot:s1728_g2.t3
MFAAAGGLFLAAHTAGAPQGWDLMLGPLGSGAGALFLPNLQLDGSTDTSVAIFLGFPRALTKADPWHTHVHRPCASLNAIVLVRVTRHDVYIAAGATGVLGAASAVLAYKVHWATWAFSVQLHEGCGSSRAPADARQAFVETGLRDVEQAGSFPRGWTGCYRMRSHFVVCDNQTDLSVDSSW